MPGAVSPRVPAALAEHTQREPEPLLPPDADEDLQFLVSDVRKDDGVETMSLSPDVGTPT